MLLYHLLLPPDTTADHRSQLLYADLYFKVDKGAGNEELEEEVSCFFIHKSGPAIMFSQIRVDTLDYHLILVCMFL